MAKYSVFDNKDYRSYLSQALDQRAETERGQRMRLARFIEVHPTYITRILDGRADLSPEQAQKVNEFLGHTPAESRLFLSLVLYARAGTKNLKDIYEEEIRKQKDEKSLLKNKTRFNRVLSAEEQARYYSSWYYAAIHICVSVANFNTKESISMALSLTPVTVNEVLEFLTEIGILSRNGTDYRQGETNLFLTPDSPFIGKHHLNWLAQAIVSLDERKEGDFHYSSVSSCSQEDKKKAREVLLNAANEIRTITSSSKKSETLFAWNIHLFGLT
jgi:uncharacterized protein (TIGR02147 family)